MKKLIAVCVVLGISAVFNTTLFANSPSQGSAGKIAAALNEWNKVNSFGDDSAARELNVERITVVCMKLENVIEDQHGTRNMNLVIGSQTKTTVIESDLVNWNNNLFSGYEAVFCEKGLADSVDCNEVELIRYVSIVPEKVFWLRAEEL
jgi:hypothetical protein